MRRRLGRADPAEEGGRIPRARVAGDWAFARTRVSGEVRVEETGDVVPIDVKQIVIYNREDGSWKISRLISNSNVE